MEGAADVFLETERKDFQVTRACGGVYFTMTTAQVVEHLGYPIRSVGWRWIPGMLAIWPNPSSHWRPGEGAVELVLGGMQQKQAAKQLGVSVGAVHLGQGVPQGRHGRVAAQKQELRAGQ